jgi:hypothetical protein
MREYAVRRCRTIAMQSNRVGSGGAQRLRREELQKAVPPREINVVVSWRLERWLRSVADLLCKCASFRHHADLVGGFSHSHSNIPRCALPDE